LLLVVKNFLKKENNMAKKLQKNTSIAKAKSLKTNVTRKFAVGGPVNFGLENLIDPENPITTTGGPAKDQFFPEYYKANKEVFDKADSEARSWGNDWFEKRKQLPQFTDTSDVFLNTFRNSAPAQYFTEEAYDKTNYLGGKAPSLATAATPALFDNIQTGNIQDAADEALKNNPYSSPKLEKGYMKTINEAGEKDYLNTNSVYYRGLEGARPYVAYEELNHIGSNIAGQIPNNTHAAGMEILGNTITPDLVNSMGYKDVDKSMGAYYADPEEYYTSLQTARKALNLDATKNYTEDEMYDILESGRTKGKSGLFNKESAEEGQMTRFYQAIGYPTGSSKFVNGKNIEDLTGDELEQYNQAKRDAVKRFLITHNAVAENKTNTEDYGLPKASRYGGYKYKNGGPNKKKEPAKKSTNQTYPPNYFVTNPRIVYHTDPREFQIASGAEADSSFAHQNTQNLINYLKVNPTVTNGIPSEIHKNFIEQGVNYNPFGKTNYPINSATGKEIKPATVGLVWPSKTPGEVYVQSKFNKGTYGPNAGKNFDKNVARDKRNRNSVTGYYTGYYPAPQEHHVLETAGEPMEPIGMKPIPVNGLPITAQLTDKPARVEGEYKTEMQTANNGVVVRVHDKNQKFIRWETPDGKIIHITNPTGSPTSDFDPVYKPKGDKDIQTSGKEQKEKLRKRRAAEKKNVAAFEMGGKADPGKRTKELSTRTKTTDQNYVIKQDMYDEGDYDSVETKTRRSLKGFIKGAPKPEAPFTRKISGEFAEGGMNKNMLNANSTTGPRSEQSWQDPGVNRFSGNTNGVNADYYFKKGGLKSKVSSKFAKLKL